MTDDYRVKSLKNSEVQGFAKKLREYHGIDAAERVDVLECAKTGKILTVDGEKPLSFELVSDSKMTGDDGATRYDGRTITISIKRSIHQRAYMGDGYARNTIAHELGHAVLHYRYLIHGASMARRSAGNVTPAWLKAYDSAEHQAKVFAPAFLINEEIASKILSADEISVRFGISRQSAEIYVAGITSDRERPSERIELAKKMRDFADEFKRLTGPVPTELRYMNDPCACCGRTTVFPVGHKFMCQTCDTVYDRFQDGDRAE